MHVCGYNFVFVTIIRLVKSAFGRNLLRPYLRRMDLLYRMLLRTLIALYNIRKTTTSLVSEFHFEGRANHMWLKALGAILSRRKYVVGKIHISTTFNYVVVLI